MIRRLMFNDIDMEYGRKIFEKKSSKPQQTADAQEDVEPPHNGEETK